LEDAFKVTRLNFIVYERWNGGELATSGFRHTQKYPPGFFGVKPVEKTAKTRTKLNSALVCHASNN